jgi:uncharacterized 2Fe-2S/4Fe-4S cluster protein (DUF4445 family)
LAIKVLFDPINREVEAHKGDVLLSVMRESGVRIESLCGGKGLCGKCKVIHERGEIEKISRTPDKFLSRDELAAGYHLACMVRLMGDCVFTIPAESRIESPKILLSAELSIERPDPSSRKYMLESSPLFDTFLLKPRRRIKLRGYSGLQPRVDDEVYTKIQLLGGEERLTATVSHTKGFPEIIDVEPGDRAGLNYGLALDVGTTTIVGLLVNLSTGDIIGRASDLNRQITYGEELVTRIAFARDPEGLMKLQRAVVSSVNDVIAGVAKEAGLDPDEITDICVGGNTVMIHLLAGIDPTYLEIANVEVSRQPIVRKSKQIGLQTNPETYVYCLPNVSRFLGGDAVGDVLASNMHKSEEISLMVDLGTNGEIIFGNSSWLFSSSCASGPAFEGEGVRHGMRGARGGIDHVRIDPDTLRADVSVIGESRPKGICGSGLIDLVAEMFRVGVLDFVGKLVLGVTPLVREGKWGLEYVVVPAEETAIGQNIVLTQTDLDYVIDSKAAACGAITVLMKKLKIGIGDVRHLYLAGAFGNYSDLHNATRLGIFPEFPNCRVHPIGNGSLSGAYATLMSMEKRREAVEIAEKTVYVDLLVDSEFIEEYSRALYIPGAKEYFPSYELSRVSPGSV